MLDFNKNQDEMEPLAVTENREANKKDEEREQWDRKIEFIFSCVGFAVGYGNFWRFPFKCFKNGGGAFLIPFMVCFLLGGLPIFFMELSVGQFTQSGPINAWRKLCPISSGIGLSMALVCFLCSVYYNVIIAWSCYYLFNSFKSEIPWVGCNHAWNTENCFDPFAASNVTTSLNESRPSPSREFFLHNVLQLSSGIEAVGNLNWPLSICLLISWVMVYFCIWKGIRTTGKVVYLTATLPYLMLLVFFINGLTLEGSLDGIKYYISPQWHKLTEPSVWIDAASQVFFSITIGFGVMLTFASYNPRKNNVYRDAIVIAFADALTSIFSGFVVFSILGYMAAIQGKDISDPSVATDGPGLVFIVYPAALATLPKPHVWAVIFFLMLITLGLDSQFGQVELICACIMEEYPKKLKKYKELVVLIACVAMLILGLTCVTEGGMYVFHLLDSYVAGSSILFLGITEALVVSWLYGSRRFRKEISLMINKPIPIFWEYIWKYVTPIVTMGIFVAGLIQYKPLTYEGSYVYPVWADVLGWLMAAFIILCVPAMALKNLLGFDGTMFTRWRSSIQPTESLENCTELQMKETLSST